VISENASDLIVLIDLQGRRVYVNPAYDRLFGGDRDLLGTDGFREVHPDDKERVKKAFFDTVQDGQNRDVEFRFLLPSGEVRWIESQSQRGVRFRTAESHTSSRWLGRSRNGARPRKRCARVTFSFRRRRPLPI